MKKEHRKKEGVYRKGKGVKSTPNVPSKRIEFTGNWPPDLNDEGGFWWDTTTDETPPQEQHEEYLALWKRRWGISKIL